MGGKTRRYFTAEKKAQIVRRHLADKIEISDLADEFEVQPSQIQTWIKQVLDQAGARSGREGVGAKRRPSPDRQGQGSQNRPTRRETYDQERGHRRANRLDRWHGSIKRECLRPAAIESIKEARRKVADYVEHYNHSRLHSGLPNLLPFGIGTNAINLRGLRPRFS